jgi:hypothetical protein
MLSGQHEEIDMTKRKASPESNVGSNREEDVEKSRTRKITIHFANEFQTGESHRHVEPTDGLDNSGYHEGNWLAATLGARILC